MVYRFTFEVTESGITAVKDLDLIHLNISVCENIPEKQVLFFAALERLICR